MHVDGKTKLDFFPLPLPQAKRLRAYLSCELQFSAIDPCVGDGALALWLVVFPKKWQEEAIGSAIGLVAGACLIYLTKVSIILVLVRPVPLFRSANLFLLIKAILAWTTNGRTINPLRVVGAALILFGLWTFCFLVLPSLV